MGFYEGITDIVTKPYVGAKKEGTLGFVKGVGKGSMNMVAKPGSGECHPLVTILKLVLKYNLAMFGLFAYPAQGVYKSMKSIGKNSVEDIVRTAKLASLERYKTSLGKR